MDTKTYENISGRILSITAWVLFFTMFIAKMPSSTAAPLHGGERCESLTWVDEISYRQAYHDTGSMVLAHLTTSYRQGYHHTGNMVPAHLTTSYRQGCHDTGNMVPAHLTTSYRQGCHDTGNMVPAHLTTSYRQGYHDMGNMVPIPHLQSSLHAIR